MKTIDLTPTWHGLMPAMLRILEDPDQSEAAKQPLRDEIMRLASAMDVLNAESKAKQKEA